MFQVLISYTPKEKKKKYWREHKRSLLLGYTRILGDLFLEGQNFWLGTYPIYWSVKAIKFWMENLTSLCWSWLLISCWFHFSFYWEMHSGAWFLNLRNNINFHFDDLESSCMSSSFCIIIVLWLIGIISDLCISIQGENSYSKWCACWAAASNF